MRTDWDALKSFARSSVQMFWLRQLMFLSATVGTVLLLESTLPVVCCFICFLAEVAEQTVGYRILNAEDETQAALGKFERAEVAIGAASAITVLVFALTVAAMENRTFHFISLFYVFSAAIYAAMFNHSVKSVLVTRLLIYAAGVVFLSLWEVIDDYPVVETEAIVQFIAVASGAVFMVWNGNEFAKIYAERRAQISELAERKKRFEDFATTASDIFFETNGALIITYASPALTAHAADREIPLLGQPVDHLRCILISGTPALIRLMRSGTPIRDLEVTMERLPDDIVEMRLSGLPIRDDAGGFAGYRCALKDVTLAVESSRRAQELTTQLQHSERLRSLGELTGGVAHEFNNILYVVQGNLELALRRGPGSLDHDTLEILSDAHAATLRAGALTRDLLAVGRKAQLNPEPVSMVDTTHAIISLLRRSFRSTIALEVDMAPDAASGGYLVTLDRAMLDHAILNIAINARDALGSAGTITFRLRRTGASSTDGRRVSLEISDTGAGMTPDVLKRAKDPYFSTKKIEQGSGIGLSVVQEFVEQSQGTLELDSAPGFGTTVKLTFRENETTCAGETTVPLTEVAQGAGETVLIVEDEPHVRALMQSMLVRLGYKPISATSGTEAWSMIESGLDVAAVVSDVDLPGGITGTELGQRLQAWDARIPMMIVSGYDLSSVEAVPWHSPRRLHQKPISLAILSTALRDLLDEARD